MDVATVTNVVNETPDSVCVTLEVPEEQTSRYTYLQGQNVTLIREISGEEVRRSYSICSSVADASLRVGIKRVENGRFSTWATTELAVGDELGILPPAGSFNVALRPESARHHLGIAAGSGITPILSILKTTLETEPESSFTLIYGNKTTETVMFLEELADLKNEYFDRLTVFHVLSQEKQNSELLSGRITSATLEGFFESLLDPRAIDEVFLCGPYEMVVDLQETLATSGISPASVHTELFGTPQTAEPAKTAASNNTNVTADPSSVQVILDGTSTTVVIESADESILDAALKVRRDLPFACKGGVCATCKAKVVEGSVDMNLNYSLSDEEVAEGYVLTCQSHPTSSDVVIDYDQR